MTISFSCHCPLEDGSELIIRASLRTLHGGAAIKCHIAGAEQDWQFTQQVQAIVQLARLHEDAMTLVALGPSGQQLILECNRSAKDTTHWQLAVILLDRLARGTSPPLSATWRAAGQIDNLLNGTCSAGAFIQHGNTKQPIDNLRQLSPFAGRALLRHQRCYFPLVGSGAHDCLSWLDVYQRPMRDMSPHAIILGVDAAQQHQAQTVLSAARSHENKPRMPWRTVLQFAPKSFVGNSWQLALVLADRISRGRAYAPRARLIATGASTRWHEGIVETVAGCEEKTRLLLAQLEPGDRIILPSAWQDTLPTHWAQHIVAKGASYVLIAQLGLW